MKRLILPAGLLLFAAACTTAPPPPAANANMAPANVNTAASPATTATFSDADIVAQEHKIWDAIKAKDFDGFAALLADDELEIESDGAKDKAKSVSEIKKASMTDYNITNTKVIKLGDDAAVLVYEVTATGTFDGKPMPNDKARATSAWVNRDGKWVAVYHQETMEKAAAPGASPSPATAKSPAAAPKASPAASAATSPAAPATPSSDVVANEKMVWAALKAKDWDTFRSLLADDSLEIEEDGMYTKSETMEGVQGAGDEMSTWTASDYKSMDVGKNAKLVHYSAQGKMNGKMMQTYESTIWRNKDGKWQAVLHHATPAQK
jgi:uncharacterized protein (TIGR02246 family)